MSRFVIRQAVPKFNEEEIIMDHLKRQFSENDDDDCVEVSNTGPESQPSLDVSEPMEIDPNIVSSGDLKTENSEEVGEECGKQSEENRNNHHEGMNLVNENCQEAIDQPMELILSQGDTEKKGSDLDPSCSQTTTDPKYIVVKKNLKRIILEPEHVVNLETKPDAGLTNEDSKENTDSPPCIDEGLTLDVKEKRHTVNFNVRLDEIRQRRGHKKLGNCEENAVKFFARIEGGANANERAESELEMKLPKDDFLRMEVS